MIGRASGLGPVLWNGTTATPLGIDIEPVAINDSGVIVGDINTYDENTGRWSIAASRWSAGTVVLLTGPTNFQRHTSVRDINNAGQVVGYAENNYLDTVATLWDGTTGLDLNTVLTPAQASHIKLYEGRPQSTIWATSWSMASTQSLIRGAAMCWCPSLRRTTCNLTSF